MNARSYMGTIPLHHAVETGKLHVVKWLLKNGADVNHRNEEEESTPLHYCAWEGHYDIAKVLIENSADVNAVNRRNHSPLSFANMRGNTRVASLLRKNGSTQEQGGGGGEEDCRMQ